VVTNMGDNNTIIMGSFAMAKGWPRGGHEPLCRGQLVQAGAKSPAPVTENPVLSTPVHPVSTPFVHPNVVENRPSQAQNAPVHPDHSILLLKIIIRINRAKR
jgi:hypothetical protein